MALIPKFFLDCVVALGFDDEGEDGPRWGATGFLYGFPVAVPELNNEKKYSIYLVTNRHVVQDEAHLWMRFNSLASDKAAEAKAPLVDANGNRTWHGAANPDVDVVVVPLNKEWLPAGQLDANFFRADANAATVSELTTLGASEGDFVYLLGFPMGIVGPGRSYVIARSGTIARIRDVLAGQSAEFLVDGFVFPGNSGGPVVSRPEVVSIKGTNADANARVIGVVMGHIPYREEAISRQTNRTRIVFEDNSGLAIAHPMDFVHEAIRAHLSGLNAKARASIV